MRLSWLRGVVAAGMGAAGLAASPAAARIEHSTLADGAEGIYVTGEIALGDEDRFAALAERYPQAVVYLDSPGGTVVSALEIGKRVRERGYRTVVLADSVCTSACALIWVAGAPRFLAPGAHLGFHATHMDEGGRLVETGVGNAIVGYYLAQLSLPEKAAVFATIAPPQDFNWLTAENSGEAGISFESAVQSLPAPDVALFNPAAPLQKAGAVAAAVASEVSGKTAPDAEPALVRKAPKTS